MNIKKEIVALIGIVFLLLGALFGVNIVSFIFGNFGTLSDTTFTDTGITIVNETEAHANTTGYTLNGASDTGAVSFTVTEVLNATDNGSGNYNLTIPLTNVTVSSVGVLTNATVIVYSNVSVSYTYSRTSENELTSDEVTNQSLQAGLTYATNASNQMNIVNITIILSLLIFLFFLFWKVIQSVQSESGGGKRKGSGNPSKSSYS